MPVYLTGQQATDRLTAMGVTATISDVDARAASYALDGTGASWEGAPPDDILDAVALMAYRDVQGGEPAIASEKVRHAATTYAAPRKGRTTTTIEALIRPYGGRLEAKLA
jgi:hypothetical protein